MAWIKPPTRCPYCEGKVTVYPVEDSESEHTVPHVVVCQNCGWLKVLDVVKHETSS